MNSKVKLIGNELASVLVCRTVIEKDLRTEVWSEPPLKGRLHLDLNVRQENVRIGGLALDEAIRIVTVSQHDNFSRYYEPPSTLVRQKSIALFLISLTHRSSTGIEWLIC